MTEKIDQFGHGIITPFQRDGKGDFANAGGIDCLKSDVGEVIGILGPTATQPGEVPWRTTMGSRAMSFKHRGMHHDMVAASVSQLAGEAVRRHERRVRVGPTVLTPNPPEYPEGTLLAKFTFVPLGTNDPQSVSVPVKE